MLPATRAAVGQGFGGFHAAGQSIGNCNQSHYILYADLPSLNGAILPTGLSLLRNEQVPRPRLYLGMIPLSFSPAPYNSSNRPSIPYYNLHYFDIYIGFKKGDQKDSAPFSLPDSS